MLSSLPKSFSFVDRFQKHPNNPILRPQGDVATDCIFNPGAVVCGDEIVMLCRCINFGMPKPADNWSVSTLTFARSRNGVDFVLDDKPFLQPDERSIYKGGFEDPRLVYLPDEKLYALTYTGVVNMQNTVGLLALSPDLKHWEFCGEVLPGRAIALCDRKIGGKYWAYYGNSNIFLACSDDLRHWETLPAPAVEKRDGCFDNVLCEAVAAPIIRDDGILLLYNGAADGAYRADVGKRLGGFRGEVNDHVYSIGWALFDRNNPSELLARSEKPILSPEYPYELYGISEYTVFGNALVEFGGNMYLYYGCSDTRIGVAIAPTDKP